MNKKCAFSAQNIENLRGLLVEYMNKQNLLLVTKKRILKMYASQIDHENIFFVYSFDIPILLKFLLQNKIELLVKIRMIQLQSK